MTARAKKPEAPPNPRAEFERLIRELAPRHQTWRVFADFCEMAAISLSQAPLPNAEREARYMKLIAAYDQGEERFVFSRMLGCVIAGLEEEPHDFLGSAFMELELGSHWHGQFFTPSSVCRMMAEMIVGERCPEIEERGFVRASEPAAGGGAMVIALSEVLKARGYNPQTQLHVTAVDVDATAAHMCFVQLSLLGIPAHVVVGNTLTLEERESFTTLMHHVGLWGPKLRRGFALGSPMDQRAEEPVEVGQAAPPEKQADPPPVEEPPPEAPEVAHPKSEPPKLELERPPAPARGQLRLF